MVFPKRLQLAKLLQATGLRSFERMRDEEIRDALQRLRTVRPLPGASSSSPSSTSRVTRSASPLPPLPPELDDEYALPFFREPRLLLPDHARTFLRAIAVRPQVCFFTWDVAVDDIARVTGQAELHLSWRSFLGDPPTAGDVAREPVALRIGIHIDAGGWYAPLPLERLAVLARLVVVNDGEAHVLATSNLTLMPPGRAALPGPLWEATLPPSIDRTRLLGRRLFLDGKLVRTKGMTDGTRLSASSAASSAAFMATRMRLLDEASRDGNDDEGDA